ncbi:UDP-N-acetylmuramoyl-L-alanine--D-glutamate ligase [Methyloglobulus sp.]|uniref:UDP-N-acetylmuramoyl-L-alanine--D-glutamate ligase n=1 Tax=Methyloglobulus sp. TaxID=2518622 RepID=UPI0032B77B56
MKLDQYTIKARLKAMLGLDSLTSKIVVVGLGVTGVSVARYLAALGFDFVIADSREQPAGIAQLREELGSIAVLSGAFDETLFSNATHLIVSPGIPLTEKAIAEAVKNGTEVIGDIDLFACSVDSPIVAITGSNGKSTVTTMLGEMAQTAGKQVGVGGNLGIPALDLLEQTAELYVLELSSFQLERTRHLNAAAATVLNVTADHLDRHSDVADYAEQKQRVFTGNGVMVINVDDPIVAAMQEESRNTLTFSSQQQADFWIGKDNGNEYLMHGEKPLMPLSELPLEGRHNAANALAALALGVAVGLDEQAMCKALKTFKGLSHRMQRVAKIAGVTWVNDSKATNIGACVAALQGYDRKVVLIAGGDAKGADMNELMPSVKAKAKSVVLMGKDAGLIEQALDGCVPVFKAASIKEAVKIAAGIAQSGESVLLSPACASLDQYKNYQDRGDKFAEAVLELAGQETPREFSTSMAEL